MKQSRGMSDMATPSKLIKQEVTAAVFQALHQYAGSTRGANMLGAGAEIIIVDTSIVQIRIPTPNGPRYFDVRVSERI